MRILYVVDGRSPIALNWIGYFVARGHEVHLASTFPCNPGLDLASLTILDVALGGVAASLGAGSERTRGRRLVRSLFPVRLRTWLRQWSGSLTAARGGRSLGALASGLQPDLVHAMRIPFEGILAGLAKPTFGTAPLLISVWGNDFTLHASANPLLGRATRRTLAVADALHADCKRDVRLAREWGFSTGKPGMVLPGAGGIQPDIFYPPPEGQTRPPVVINPRGVRDYVRSDTFFRAVPLVLEAMPSARFICPAMAGEKLALDWIRSLGIEEAVELLPLQTRPQMANLFRRARVVVSPSTHDGTPNTLLEAMACGCYPVAGDIESLREWIQPGINGALVDPGDVQALAEAIVAGLRDGNLRAQAQRQNQALVAERATYARVMADAEAFYENLLVGHQISAVS